MKTIQLPSLSRIKSRWMSVLALAVVAVASFSIGAFANQLVVQQIQSLSGSQVLVPAPELQILSSSWNINLNTSSIVAVILNVTTVDQNEKGESRFLSDLETPSFRA